MGDGKNWIDSLSEPLIKLIECVSGGIGKVYEPMHIKRIAKAKAAEIATVSEAMANNITLPIVYDDGKILISTQDYNDLAIRARNRLCFQEVKKQQNIEAVISNAYTELETVNSVSNTPVDEDWINSFFDSVAYVSSEQMQRLWGKLLAGEVESPGSFSLRTLDVLKRLSTKEANIFKNVSPYVLNCSGDYERTYVDYFLMPNEDNDLLSKYNISFADIMLLSEAGLMYQSSQIFISVLINKNKSELIRGLSSSISISTSEDTNVRLIHPAHLLTEAGKELLPTVLNNEMIESANAYLLDCLDEIKTNGNIQPIGSRENLCFKVMENSLR